MSAMLPTTMAAKEYATIAELAAHYDVEEVTIWKWLRQAGTAVTHYKRTGDKKTYIKRAELAAWRHRPPSDDFEPRAPKEKR